ncbi:hypothetical protein [Dyella flagellata]|uniref:Uncharacterized protein n=1 Tax=Dyella flagellata TaxID=1867833 RepID=A0ABQ5XDZ2_9GAMM|nr:hypothetical protein [Dyella flagellata]GLQ89722.1 hypothetical protein GCM10007898_32970 [Dyella flagellata]
MFRLLVCAVLALGTAAAFAAPQSETPSDQHTSSSSKTVSRSPLKPGDRGCIRDTGSLIKPKPGECLPVAGRSYSKQDIDNTGETRLGPALERLDPAVTVQGGGGH